MFQEGFSSIVSSYVPENKEKTLFDFVSDSIDKKLATDLASKPKAKSKGSREKEKKQNNPILGQTFSSH